MKEQLSDLNNYTRPITRTQHLQKRVTLRKGKLKVLNPVQILYIRGMKGTFTLFP